MDEKSSRPCMTSLDDWMHESKNNARPLILPCLDDFGYDGGKFINLSFIESISQQIVLGIDL